MFRPREVQEPLTGTRWVARSRSEYWLAWLPTAAVLVAFLLGLFAGFVFF